MLDDTNFVVNHEIIHLGYWKVLPYCNTKQMIEEYKFQFMGMSRTDGDFWAYDHRMGASHYPRDKCWFHDLEVSIVTTSLTKIPNLAVSMKLGDNCVLRYKRCSCCGLHYVLFIQLMLVDIVKHWTDWRKLFIKRDQDVCVRLSSWWTMPPPNTQPTW